MAFIARTACRIIAAYLIMDVSHALMRRDPAVFLYSGADKVEMVSRSFALRCFYIMVQVYYTAASLSIQYYVLGIVMIAFHLGEPQYWPDLIGNITDAYTIRRFWK